MQLFSFNPAPTDTKPNRLFAFAVGENAAPIAFDRGVAGLQMHSGYFVGTKGQKLLANGVLLNTVSVAPGSEMTFQDLMAYTGNQIIKDIVQKALPYILNPVANTARVQAPAQPQPQMQPQAQPQMQYQAQAQPQVQYQAQPQMQPQYQQPVQQPAQPPVQPPVQQPAQQPAQPAITDDSIADLPF